MESLNFEDTKLTLGLPGTSDNSKVKYGTKRGFYETIDQDVERSDNDEIYGESDNSNLTKPTITKAQVVGWPPVRNYRKNAMESCKYIKVAVDGAPYLRKVDLQMYSNYRELINALENMFSCFTMRNYLNERIIMDHVNGVEYVPTYEDKDGDWMLVGDVPWKMFAESCKRLRLMKSSEAIGLTNLEKAQD